MKKNSILPNAGYYEVKKFSPLEWEKHRPPSYWEYRRKWIEYPERLYVADAPLHIDIETTNACNLSCPMCIRTIFSQKGKLAEVGFMQFDFYKRLIDEAADMRVYSVKLNFLGEPLLHKDLSQQIKYAKKRGILEVMLNTNAVLLDEEMSRELLDAGLDSIFFSFDSPYREKYNEIRIGADFDLVVENIKRFIAIKASYPHVQTRVSMVAMDVDEKEVEDYKKMWLDLVEMVGIGEHIPHHNTEELPYVEGFRCAQLFQRMFVLWTGRTVACCNQRQKLATGDANKNSLREIWRGDEYTHLRDLMQSSRYYEIGLCRSCSIPHCEKGE